MGHFLTNFLHNAFQSVHNLEFCVALLNVQRRKKTPKNEKLAEQRSNKQKVAVYLTSAYSDAEPIEGFLQSVKASSQTKHVLVDKPEAADIILFIENSRYHHDRYFEKLIQHPLVKQYPEKVYMYNPHDTPWLVLPGLYPCMPKERFDKKVVAASPYIETVNPYIQCDFSRLPTFLFSFFGTPYTGVRARVAKLTHPKGEIRAYPQKMYGEGRNKTPQMQYAELLTDSKFVLCPRGIGTSSLRLFEVMQAGRAPVIISDNWVPPAGPNWESFAIFVKEQDIEKIPFILESQEHQWEQRGRRAREAWERYFAPEVVFDYMVEAVLSLESLVTYHQPLEMSFFQWAAREKYRFRFLRNRFKSLLNPKKLLSGK